jgi:hypothetical protein
MLTSKTSRWALITAVVLLITICSFSPAQIIYTAVQVIQNAGSSLNGHTTLNFTGGLTATENVGANRNEAAIASSAALPGSPTTTTQSQNDNSTKIATTAYTDLAVANGIAGVNPAVSVTSATTTVLPNTPTYSNGAAGIGATLTAGTAAALVIDGYTPVLLDRILVKNQASALQNGVYFLSTLGTGIIPYILTRSLDFNQPSDINSTGAIPVLNGTVNGSTQWVVSSKVTTVGTDAITFTQFTTAPSLAVGGGGPYFGYLTNVTYPPAYALSIGTGDIDIYTVPANRKAYAMTATVSNSSGSNIVALPEVKIGASYFPLAGLGVTSVTLTYGTAIATINPIILNATEKLSVNTNGSGLSIWYKVIEFDASNPLVSARITSFSVGDNTLYTVTAAKTVEFFNEQLGIALTSAPVAFTYVNRSGTTRTVNAYAVPSGGSTANQNSIFQGTVSNNNQKVQIHPGNLSPGDFIVLNVDANTATQFAWVNYVER